MRVLDKGRWLEGFLDYYKEDDQVMIGVIANIVVCKIDEQYFERKKSFRLLWNYLFEIGPVNVIRKIISRSNERIRNQKYLSIGIGKVLSGNSEAGIYDGAWVVYMATSHPFCVDRIVLPVEFVRAVDDFIVDALPKGKLICKVLENPDLLSSFFELKGWNACSGLPIPDNVDMLLNQAIDFIRGFDWGRGQSWSATINDDKKNYYKTGRDNIDKKKKAVLYGYGNYAKTVIIPNIKNELSICVIHEIDPVQIPRNAANSMSWSTSPQAHGKGEYDAYLIAGYHHTHAQLAIDALNNDAYAVVEKPVVVDKDQLGSLVRAMENASKGLFSCFHKRYLPLNDLAFEDFGFSRGERPVSYHCIVYEVPLPRLHWYKWPNSKSRLVSNGCHWIDHFLYLNDFKKPVKYQLFVAADGTINCSVELENGAVFSMLLTDVGSERIGVQDYIELRHGDITVMMKNGSEYLSENSIRVIRKARINKMESYNKMYEKISIAIAKNNKGDTIDSLKVSSGLVLALEEKFNELRDNKL